MRFHKRGCGEISASPPKSHDNGDEGKVEILWRQNCKHPHQKPGQMVQVYISSVWRCRFELNCTDKVKICPKWLKKLQDAFTRPWDNHFPSFPNIQPDGLPDHPPRLPSIGQVKATLNELSARKATGVDNIPAWVLKKFSDELNCIVMTLWKIFAVDTQFKQLRKRSLKKIQASAGFEPLTSVNCIVLYK